MYNRQLWMILRTVALLSMVTMPCLAVAQDECDPLSGLAILLPVEYDERIQPFFDAECVSCHQPGGEGFEDTGLDLRPGVSYDHLVGVASNQDPDWVLVEPFELNNSLLWHKINCNDPPVGDRMPKDAVPLDPVSEQIWFVYWILGGARRTLDKPPPIAPRPINFGMSGTWYNRETSGQGFIFDVVPERDPPLFVAYWFTFADEEGGPEGQRWYFADGNYEPGEDRVALDVYMVTGGRFGQRPPAPAMEIVGEAVVSFHSCIEGTFSYRIDLDGDPSLHADGGFHIERLSPDVMCEALSEGE